MKTSHTALALILAAGAPAMANSTAPDNQASQVGDQASQNASAQTRQVDQLSASAFSRWDANNNDRLDDGEFSQGLHQNWSGESGELDQAAGYGTRGRYAYPFYGYGYGWAPGSRYYDLPYSRDDSVTLTPFDYDRINEG